MADLSKHQEATTIMYKEFVDAVKRQQEITEPESQPVSPEIDVGPWQRHITLMPQSTIEEGEKWLGYFEEKIDYFARKYNIWDRRAQPHIKRTDTIVSSEINNKGEWYIHVAPIILGAYVLEGFNEYTWLIPMVGDLMLLDGKQAVDLLAAHEISHAIARYRHGLWLGFDSYFQALSYCHEQQINFDRFVHGPEFEEIYADLLDDLRKEYENGYARND